MHRCGTWKLGEGQSSLGFFQPWVVILFQGEKNAVDENCENDEVVEELVGGHVDSRASNGVPRRQKK